MIFERAIGQKETIEGERAKASEKTTKSERAIHWENPTIFERPFPIAIISILA